MMFVSAIKAALCSSLAEDAQTEYIRYKTLSV